MFAITADVADEGQSQNCSYRMWSSKESKFKLLWPQIATTPREGVGGSFFDSVGGNSNHAKY